MSEQIVLVSTIRSQEDLLNRKSGLCCISNFCFLQDENEIRRRGRIILEKILQLSYQGAPIHLQLIRELCRQQGFSIEQLRTALG